MAGAILFERAQALTSVNREEGISLLNKIVREQEVAENDEELIRIKEQGILQLGELYKQEGKAKELADLIKVTRPFLSLISKAKAAKLVRSLVDFFLDLEASTGIEVQLCKECIEWAKQEKRTFLRQSLEARLIALYFDTGLYTDALQLGSTLLKELKKLDDKMLLVEVQLLESKTYHALSNLPRVSFILLTFFSSIQICCMQKVQVKFVCSHYISHYECIEFPLFLPFVRLCARLLFFFLLFCDVNYLLVSCVCDFFMVLGIVTNRLCFAFLLEFQTTKLVVCR